MNGQKKYDNVFNLIFKEVIEIQSRLIPYNNVSYKLLPSFNTEEHLRNKKIVVAEYNEYYVGYP